MDVGFRPSGFHFFPDIPDMSHSFKQIRQGVLAIKTSAA
jgi:hypothetical protein